MSTSSALNFDPSDTPIGGYLVEAGLITPAQVSVVLNDQQMETNMLFGEVLVARGWVKLETIEFIMTRVVEPERRAALDRKLSESLTESFSESPTELLPNPQKQTQPPQQPPPKATKPIPPPYPTTSPRVARARSLNGDFEIEIFESLTDTSFPSGASSGPPTTSACRNDRKSLPSVREDGGVNWAG